MNSFQLADRQRWSVSTDEFLISNHEYLCFLDGEALINKANEAWQDVLLQADNQLEHWQETAKAQSAQAFLNQWLASVSEAISKLNIMAIENKQALLNLCEVVTQKALGASEPLVIINTSIEKAFDEITLSPTITVTIHPNHAQKHKNELQNHLNEKFSQLTVDLVFRDSLQPYDCFVESAFGRVEFNVFNDLKSHFRGLCE